MDPWFDDEHTLITGAVSGWLGRVDWWDVVDMVRDDRGNYTNVIVLETTDGHRYRVTVDREP